MYHVRHLTHDGEPSFEKALSVIPNLFDSRLPSRGCLLETGLAVPGAIPGRYIRLTQLLEASSRRSSRSIQHEIVMRHPHYSFARRLCTALAIIAGTSAPLAA